MAQTLQTNIVINATSNGFGEIGNTLSVLGAQIDALSTHLINFGKDSLKTYEGYEKSFKQLESIWGSNGTFAAGSRELSSALGKMDTSVREWARDGIIDLDDYGNALVDAAHAGWDMNDMLASMPAVKNMAIASDMDLSSSLDMVLKSMAAMGIDSKDPAAVLEWTDKWIFAANRSAATAEEFGQTFLRMGSTMRLTDPDELLALTAVMANMGTTGSAAATLVRNSLLRLLAPSQTGKAFLDQLGATDEEINSIREDTTKLAAFDELYARGFNVFDENGQAKSTLQVYSELGQALADIAGGYDNIIGNETALAILSNVFGVKSMTGALNIVNGLETAYDIFNDLESGMAEGVGQYTADTIAESLWGKLENWENKVDALKLRTGEVLAEQVEPVLEVIGGIVDGISTLDTGTFNALVAGLEVIAAAGPGLVIAGGAFRFLAYAMTPAGGIGLTAIALTAAAAAINELEKADFESKFGDLELDSSGVQNYVQQLSQDFQQAYSNVNQFKTALDEAVTSYTDASASFKESLLSDMLTGVEIEEGSEEYTKLTGLGEQMISAIIDGEKGAIANNYAALMSSITTSFAEGGDPDQVNDPIWVQMMGVIEQGMQADIDRANELAQELRNALTSALGDGHLTADEIGKIQSIMDEQNALLAQQQDREHYLERQKMLRKAQTLGLDTIRESSEQIEKERNAELEDLMSRQDADYYDMASWYDKAIENGWNVPNTDGTPGEHAATQEDKNTALAALKDKQAQEQYAWSGRFSDFLMGLWTEGITSSDLSGAWSALEQLAGDFRQAGGMVTQDAANAFNSQVGPRESTQLQQYLTEMVNALGGYEALQGYADYFASQGDTEMAQRYQQIMDMYDALGQGPTQVSPQVGTQGQGDYSDVAGTYGQIDALLKGAYGQNTSMTPEALSQYISEQRGMGLEPDWQSKLGDDLWSQFNAAAQQSGFGNITDMIEAAVPGDAEMEVTPVMDESNLDTSLDPIPVDIQPRMDDVDAAQQLEDQGVQVDVDGDTQQLQATIDGADGQTLMEYVSGDATNLAMSIQDQNGKTLVENVHGNASSLAATIRKYDGMTITVNIRGNKMFASGGRATEASIFGEAGPEWAIPEQHTQRTAELLDAARAASGFTWPELLARNGGMNANPNNTPTTLVYSPTIYAQNAEGVEEKLIADKARLEKWFANKQMMDRMEVYS